MSLILELVNKNTGEILKQGDTTLLKYQLKDGNNEPLNIKGADVWAVLKRNNQAVYSTKGELSEGNIVSFRITDILEPTTYEVEIVVKKDEQTTIFPSDNKTKLRINTSIVSSVEGELREESDGLKPILKSMVGELVAESGGTNENEIEWLTLEFKEDNLVMIQIISFLYTEDAPYTFINRSTKTSESQIAGAYQNALPYIEPTVLIECKGMKLPFNTLEGDAFIFIDPYFSDEDHKKEWKEKIMEQAKLCGLELDQNSSHYDQNFTGTVKMHVQLKEEYRLKGW